MQDPSDTDRRERALRSLKKKRDFAAHIVVYLAVNALLIGIWATTASRGFFWPLFPIAGWGIAILMQGWDVYRGEPTEDQIRREIDRLG